MTGKLEPVEGHGREQEVIPTGTGCAGRKETGPAGTPEKGYPRHRTVKGRKGIRKNPGGRAATGKRNGQHVPRGMFEATGILREEGYIVGRITASGSVFDLEGWSHAGSILVRVVRPKVRVENARDISELYETEIRTIEPYYRSETDNLQFWVFSRECGLLRYRVFDWGIGNVRTMQKIMKTPQELPSDKQTAAPEHANRRARNSPCPDMQTGLARVPDTTPLHAAIPS